MPDEQELKQALVLYHLDTAMSSLQHAIEYLECPSCKATLQSTRRTVESIARLNAHDPKHPEV